MAVHRHRVAFYRHPYCQNVDADQMRRQQDKRAGEIGALEMLPAFYFGQLSNALCARPPHDGGVCQCAADRTEMIPRQPLARLLVEFRKAQAQIGLHHAPALGAQGHQQQSEQMTGARQSPLRQKMHQPQDRQRKSRQHREMFGVVCGRGVTIAPPQAMTRRPESCSGCKTKDTARDKAGSPLRAPD